LGFSAVNARLDKVEQQVNTLKSDMNSIKSTNRYLVENSCRQSVAKLFGERFSRPFLVKSVMDIPILYESEIIEYQHEEREEYQETLLAAVKKSLPRFYEAFALQANVEGLNFPTSFQDLVESDGSINQISVKMMGRNLSHLKGREGFGLNAIAQRVYNTFAKNQTLESALGSLKNSAGPGLAIALWESDPNKALFQTELEVDCRGRFVFFASRL
jgi:hypothetical protein